MVLHQVVPRQILDIMRQQVLEARQRQQQDIMRQQVHVVRQRVLVAQSIVQRVPVHVRLYQLGIIRQVATVVVMHAQVKLSVPREHIVAVVYQITVQEEHMVQRQV